MFEYYRFIKWAKEKLYFILTVVRWYRVSSLRLYYITLFLNEKLIKEVFITLLFIHLKQTFLLEINRIHLYQKVTKIF